MAKAEVVIASAFFCKKKFILLSAFIERIKAETAVCICVNSALQKRIGKQKNMFYSLPYFNICSCLPFGSNRCISYIRFLQKLHYNFIFLPYYHKQPHHEQLYTR